MKQLTLGDILKFVVVMQESGMTNEEIISNAQAQIIARSENPYYPVEQHLKDMDLIAELTELKKKYK